MIIYQKILGYKFIKREKNLTENLYITSRGVLLPGAPNPVCLIN